MTLARAAVLFCLGSLLFASNATAQSWNQWRGPNRAGMTASSPALIEKLPDGGITPNWVSETNMSTGSGGGWSSPVTYNGNVYVFVHEKSKREDVQLGEEKIKKLTDEQKDSLTQEEFKAYEQRRKAEQTKRRDLQYQYTEKLYCYNAEDGVLRWVSNHRSRSSRHPHSSTPAIVDGVVYQSGARGQAWAVDAASGDDLWTTQLPGEWDEEHYAASPIVADGVMVVTKRHWYGIDAKTGKFLWKSEEEVGNDHASPTLWRHDGKEYVIANAKNETVCIDPASGKQLWQVESQGGRSTPLVSGDRLITYGNSRKGGVRCYRLTTEAAEHQWTCTAVADEGCSPVIVGENVYAQGDRTFVCIDLKTGDLNWRTRLDMAKPRYTSLIAADDKVIFAAEGVLIAAADAKRYEELAAGKINREGLLAAETFHRDALDIDKLEQTAEGQKKAESLWRKEIDGAGPAQCVTPAIADGRLYLRLRSNRLACYDLRETSSR